MATQDFIVKGTNVNGLFTHLRDVGVAEEAAGLLVSEWLAENLGKRRRSFQFRTDFPEQVAACNAVFQRTFAHTDWVDGESVVQAGETPTEEGFNKRFHALEADLDTVKGDLVRAFECLAEMRRTLRAMFNELVAEINTINGLLGETQPLPPVSTFPGNVNQGTFAGTVKFGDKDMLLWNTNQGQFLLPKTPEVVPDIRNPRFNSAGVLQGKFLEQPAIAENFPEEVAVKDLVEKFGNEVLIDGRTVAEVVKILPPDFTAPNLGELVNQVAEREAGAIRTEIGATEAIKNNLGISFEREAVATAPVENATFLPPTAGEALKDVGVVNIEKLAGSDPVEVHRQLTDAGVRVSPGEVARWQGIAKTLTRLR
jgi:hypothetical protein